MIEQPPRNNAIDFLRGFSISAVILSHCYMYMPLRSKADRLSEIILESGYHGVVVFFVISGFLITSHSLRKWGSLQHIRCHKFYQMRSARIFPCLLALIIILTILHSLSILGYGIKTTSLAQAIFAALTFHINWLEAKTGLLPGNWSVLWSLSIEEVFYLFFPIICIITRKISYFIVVMLAFVFLGPFARMVWNTHFYLSCMDSIAIGCLCALFAKFKTDQIPRSNQGAVGNCERPIIFQNVNIYKIILLIGTLFLIFVFFFRQEFYFSNLLRNALSVSLLEIGTGLILIAMHVLNIALPCRPSGLTTGASILTTPFCWFGRNSYEIYLTHMFFVIEIRKLFFATTQSVYIIFCLYLFAFILSGICGQLVASFFSEPLNKFLRRTSQQHNYYVQEYT